MIKPEVGMPVTVGIGGDRYAGEVTSISPSGKTIMVRGMKFMLKPFPKGYTGPETHRWKTAGKRSGYYLILGIAENYLDPSF